MLTNADNLARYERLINEAWQILHAAGWDGLRYTAFTPSGAECLRIRSEALQLIRDTLGENSPFYTRIAADAPPASIKAADAIDVPRWAHALQAAAEQYRRDAVFENSPLISTLDEAHPDLAATALNAGDHNHATTLALQDIESRLRNTAATMQLPQQHEPHPVGIVPELVAMGHLPDDLASRLVDALLTFTKPTVEPTHDDAAKLIQLARDLQQRLN